MTRRRVAIGLAFVLVGWFVGALLGAMAALLSFYLLGHHGPRRVVGAAAVCLALAALATVAEGGGLGGPELAFASSRPTAALLGRLAGLFLTFGLVGLIDQERAGRRKDEGDQSEARELPEPAATRPDTPVVAPVFGGVPRRFWAASVAGGLVAVLAFGWVVMGGQADLFREEELADFYDLQAQALLDLRWDVPEQRLGIEAFVVDGRSYTYFGPTPALVRLPVSVVTDEYEGRLSRIAMLSAFVLAMVYLCRLHGDIRTLVRGDAAVSSGEAALVALLTAGLGAGSVLLFLGSRAWVYHEAVLWGVAFTIAAFFHLLRFIRRPRPLGLVVTSMMASLAFLSRGSVGVSPLVVLSILALGQWWVQWREPTTTPPRATGGLAGPRRLGLDPDGWRSFGLPLTIAAAVPASLYMYVNWAKFGTLVRVPYELQVWSGISSVRQQTLAANDGSLFGLQFMPSHLWQMLRPDALGFDTLFPWLTYPDAPSVIGRAQLDRLDYSSSVTTNSTLLFLLGCVGAVAIWRHATVGTGAVSMLRVLVLGAGVGALVTTTIGFIAYRYQADSVPLLVITALAGGHVAHVFLADRWSLRPGLRRSALAVAATATALSIVVSLALAMIYQRQLSDPVPMEERAAFVELQYDVHSNLPGGDLPRVVQGDELPPSAPFGTVFLLGDCDGLYWSDAHRWYALEQTNASGRFHLDVEPGASGVPQPLLAVTGRDGRPVHLLLRPLEDDHFGFILDIDDRVRFDRSGVIHLPPGEQMSLDIEFDERLGRVRVHHDGLLVFAAPFNGIASGLPIPNAGPAAASVAEEAVVIGEAVAPITGTRPAFEGRIENRSLSAELCGRFRDRLG